MTGWGWKPERKLGIWRYGAGWLKPIVAAVPYVTVILLFVLLLTISGTLTSAKGVLFDLPAGTRDDGEQADLVALVLPLPHDTVVFFDDSRYLLDDPTSMRSFGENLSASVSHSERKALMVLADRRVSTGALMALADAARKSGVRRVLFAERRAGGTEE